MPKLKVKLGPGLGTGQDEVRPLAFPTPNVNPVTPSSVPEEKKVRVKTRIRLIERGIHS